MSERNSRIMYLGKFMNADNQIRYRYGRVNESNKLVDRNWIFKSKIFKKGSIGSIYECDIEGTNIRYTKSEVPTSFVKEENGHLTSTFIKFKELEVYEEESRQLEEKIRLSKGESQRSIEVSTLKKIYRELNTREKASFIAEIVRKITT